jgi:hypothetical protein
MAEPEKAKSSPYRPLLAALALVFAAVASPAGAQAPAPAAFTVRNVNVDQTAETAAQAREAARSQGQQLAFHRLLERLVPRDYRHQLPALSPSEIGDLVVNFEVQTERASAVRYIATLTYRFSPDGVRATLRRAGIPFAETTARPLVVLPVFREGGAPVLWDQSNSWLDAWRGLTTLSDGLQPLVVPLGDLSDMGTIDADRAAANDISRFEAMAKRYGAGGVLVTEATVVQTASGPVLQVAATRFDAGVPGQTLVGSYAPDVSESQKSLFARAAAQTAQAVEERWKSDIALRSGQEASLVANVSYKDLAEWVDVRQRLADTAVVRKTEIVSLSRSGARVELRYVGSPSALRLALAQKDLVLAQDGDIWALSLRQADADGNSDTGG